MKVTFSDKALEDIYIDKSTSSKKYKKFCKNAKLVRGYIMAVEYMFEVTSTAELAKFSFLHYEKLKHCNKSSLRIVNGHIERLIFTESEDGIEVDLIEIDDTHYGNK